jgi:hypothetical protein
VEKVTSACTNCTSSTRCSASAAAGWESVTRNLRDAGPGHFPGRRRGAEGGIKVKPEVMIPLVGFKKELDLQAEIVHRVAKEVMKETGKSSSTRWAR